MFCIHSGFDLGLAREGIEEIEAHANFALVFERDRGRGAKTQDSHQAAEEY
jgi:hypothetical protein